MEKQLTKNKRVNITYVTLTSFPDNSSSALFEGGDNLSMEIGRIGYYLGVTNKKDIDTTSTGDLLYEEIHLYIKKSKNDSIFKVTVSTKDTDVVLLYMCFEVEYYQSIMFIKKFCLAGHSKTIKGHQFCILSEHPNQQIWQLSCDVFMILTKVLPGLQSRDLRGDLVTINNSFRFEIDNTSGMGYVLMYLLGFKEVVEEDEEEGSEEEEELVLPHLEFKDVPVIGKFETYSTTLKRISSKYKSDIGIPPTNRKDVHKSIINAIAEGDELTKSKRGDPNRKYFGMVNVITRILHYFKKIGYMSGNTCIPADTYDINDSPFTIEDNNITVSPYLLATLNVCKRHKGLAVIPVRLKTNDSGHANSLIINFDTNEAERFDPNTKTYTLKREKSTDDTIERYLKKELGIEKYVPPDRYCPKIGIQTSGVKEEFNTQYKRYGYCSAYTALYIHMRLVYPSVDRKMIVDHMFNLPKILGPSYNITRVIASYGQWLVNQFISEDEALGIYDNDKGLETVDRYTLLPCSNQRRGEKKRKGDNETQIVASKWRDETYAFSVCIEGVSEDSNKRESKKADKSDVYKMLKGTLYFSGVLNSKHDIYYKGTTIRFDSFLSFKPDKTKGLVSYLDTTLHALRYRVNGEYTLSAIPRNSIDNKRKTNLLRIRSKFITKTTKTTDLKNEPDRQEIRIAMQIHKESDLRNIRSKKPEGDISLPKRYFLIEALNVLDPDVIKRFIDGKKETLDSGKTVQLLSITSRAVLCYFLNVLLFAVERIQDSPSSQALKLAMYDSVLIVPFEIIPKRYIELPESGNQEPKSTIERIPIGFHILENFGFRKVVTSYRDKSVTSLAATVSDVYSKIRCTLLKWSE